MQRNCCLTLCNFSIPEELEFQYSRVNQLLLKILEPARQEESIQRIAVHLCNALVCQVDNHHKEAVGKMGFVKVLFSFMRVYKLYVVFYSSHNRSKTRCTKQDMFWGMHLRFD